MFKIIGVKLWALVVLLIIFLFSLTLNVYFYISAQNEARRPHFYRRDIPYIQKAQMMWAKHNGQPLSQVRELRYPQAFYIGRRTCISLNLLKGSVGGVPVYCFDENLNPVLVYQDVD